MIRLSRLPALTPMRIGVPLALAARADLADLAVELADVARVDAHGGAAGVDRREDVLALEVDVGDHRDLRLLDDLRQGLGVDRVGHGDAHDLAARGGQRGDLLQRRVDVGGHRRRHRLHADRARRRRRGRRRRRAAGRATLGQAGGRELGHAERDGTRSLEILMGLTMSAPSSQTVNPAKSTTTAYVSGSSLVRSTRSSSPV
jgi:hypothetical protein